jgi:iron-sulfur cluster assembly accessory protein
MELAGINLTPTAVDAMRDASSEESALGVRLAVVGGGCSGYSSNMDFIDNLDDIDDDDITTDDDGLLVVVDQHTAGMLIGTTVDYVITTMSRGFTFINPNAKTTCGCGSSFS